MNGSLRRAAVLSALVAGLSSSARAQQVHLLVVNGLAGEPRFRAKFERTATMLVDTARTRWGVPDASIVVLAEDTTGAMRRARRATRDEIAQAFVRLSRRVAP